MIIEKLLETRVDMFDINHIYSANYAETILSLLKKKYINRCFKSCYILEILEIVRKSQIMCKTTTIDSCVYVDVMFKVKAMIFEKGEIIHNCKIVQITDDGKMYARADHISLKINNISAQNIFKVNEEIPAIVNMVRYIPFSEEIVVSAISLMPIKPQLVAYKILEDNDIIPTDSSLQELNLLKSKLRDLEKSHTNVCKLFRELLYPYKQYPFSFQGKLNEFKLNIVNINDIIFFPPQRLNEMNFYYLNQIPEDITEISIPRNEFEIKVLTTYSKNINQLIEFVENYSSLEKIKKYTYLWNFYKSLKN